MSRKKSLSKHLSRRERLNPAEFYLSAREFWHGPDRAAAIVGGALVEDALVKVIRAFLADPTDESALFYDLGSPFGTFRARIVAGKALGLFDDAMADDMDQIRDIRNQFAHALLSIDFGNQHIRDACAKIRDYSPDEPMTKRDLSPARLHYENACWKINALLMDKANAILDTRSWLADDSKAARLQGGPNDVLGDIDPD